MPRIPGGGSRMSVSSARANRAHVSAARGSRPAFRDRCRRRQRQRPHSSVTRIRKARCHARAPLSSLDRIDARIAVLCRLVNASSVTWRAGRRCPRATGRCESLATARCASCVERPSVSDNPPPIRASANAPITSAAASCARGCACRVSRPRDDGVGLEDGIADRSRACRVDWRIGASILTAPPPIGTPRTRPAARGARRYVVGKRRPRRPSRGTAPFRDSAVISRITHACSSDTAFRAVPRARRGSAQRLCRAVRTARRQRPGAESSIQPFSGCVFTSARGGSDSAVNSTPRHAVN